VFPTPAHYFIKLLHQKGHLFKVFTQNTDALHLKSGMFESDVIHAHGVHAAAVCAVCGARDSIREMKEAFKLGEVRWCQRCRYSGQRSPIKPGVVFFNESLPREFHEAA